MFTELNTVVQALVWTTLAGLMYAVWLHSRDSNSKYTLGLSVQVKNVTNLLQALWMLLAIGLVISLIIFSAPYRGQSASAADSNCAPAPMVSSPEGGVDRSTNAVCSQVDTSASKQLPDALK